MAGNDSSDGLGGRIKAFTDRVYSGTQGGQINLALGCVLLISILVVWSRGERSEHAISGQPLAATESQSGPSQPVGERLETTTASQKPTPSPRKPVPLPTPVAQSDQSRSSCQAALSRARQHLEKQEFQQAHDYLLASLRLDPSEPTLFETVVGFVKATVKNADPKVEALAEDLYRRADLLVTYQPLDNLISARQQHVKLGELFAEKPGGAGSPESEPPAATDPFDEIRQSVDRAGDAAVPLPVRSKLLERARNDLNALAERAALKELDPLPADFWKRHSGMESGLEKEEIAVLLGLFSKQQDTIRKWLDGPCSTALAKARDADTETAPAASTSLADELQACFRHLNSLTPFVDSSVPGAKQLHVELRDKMDLLDKTKEWLYNQQALRRIQSIEVSDEAIMDKIRRLVEIREERLAPYIATQFNRVWDDTFRKCNADDRLEATRLRIIRRDVP